ncbi:S24 family peptidase [Thermodesulfobacteriota bacterium]
MGRLNLTDSPRDRLKHLMELFEFDTDYGMARALSISRSTLHNVLNRDSIGPKTARRIANALGLEYNWVKNGEGPMSKPGAEIEGYIGFSGKEAALKVTETSDETDGASISAQSTEDFVFVPKATSKLSAGGGIIADKTRLPKRFGFRKDWIERVASDPSNIIVMEVEGDSMNGTLRHGDTVLIDLGRTDPQEGGITAIAVGDVIQVKRLEPLPNDRLRVQSDNRAYYDYTVSSDEIQVIGKVIWFARTLV